MLNKTGKKVKKNFEKEYGIKKGDRIFSGYESRHKDLLLKGGK
jgi:hypothetical protein